MSGQTSRPFAASSGVPQGSHLGPLLFCVFINDISDEFIDCLHLLYADDLKLFRRVDSPADSQILQENLDSLQRWCARNRMSLSVHKCSTISFSRRTSSNIITSGYSINGEELQRLQVVNDLGVLLDSRMTFKPQVNQVVQRSKAVWAFVKRQSREFSCPYVAKALYCALVRSKLEYCSVVWSPIYECDKIRLESVQKQFLLFALRGLNWTSRYEVPPYEARLTLLNMDSLQDRRTMAAFQFARALLGDSSLLSVQRPLISFLPSRTRQSTVPRLRQPPLGRTRYEDNSPLRRAVTAFNQMAVCHNAEATPVATKRYLRAAIAEARRQRLSARGYLQSSTSGAIVSSFPSSRRREVLLCHRHARYPWINYIGNLAGHLRIHLHSRRNDGAARKLGFGPV